MQKKADGESSGSSLLATAAKSSLPTPTIVSRLAPGKRGPSGMGHRNSFAPSNTGTVPAPDAGAMSQKSLPPKYGSIAMKEAGMVPRPTLQDMIKAASNGTMSRTRVAEEARRQTENITGEKVASAQEETHGSVSTAYVEKLGEALDFLAGEFTKGASSIAPPARISEHIQEPGKGPGSLEVSQATASTTLPEHHGQGHHQPPTKPGEAKVRPSDAAGNALETNMKSTGGTTPQKVASDLKAKNLEVLKKIAAPKTASEKCEKCGKDKAACSCKPTEKSASDLLAANRARLGVKQAEDAINPSHISAGAAVAPETSAGGEAGGEPAGGKPGPNADLVSSNKGAIDYTKGQAKSGPKGDLKKWLTEPALTSSTDSTLRDVFDSTGQAGTKFGSASQGAAPEKDNTGVKTAAARAFLESLLEEQPTV